VNSIILLIVKEMYVFEIRSFHVKSLLPLLAFMFFKRMNIKLF